MKNILSSCIFFVLSTLYVNAQVDFQSLTLEEINSDKPIFIDVYTTWCGPCKQMDRTTFQDSVVSAILNENYTCLKWNAEDDRFLELAKGFEVKAYPTFLFLNRKRELVNTQVGFLVAEDLTKVSEEVLSFLEVDPLDNINISSLNLDESTELLAQQSWSKTTRKNELLQHMFDLNGTSDSLWKSTLDLLSISAHYDLELEYVEKLTSYQEPINFYSKRSWKTVAKGQAQLSKVLEHKLDQAKIAADYKLYIRISKLRGELALVSGTTRKHPSYSTKQFQTDRLEYYRYNNLVDYYKPLADSLVSEYILPHNPAEVLAADERKSRVSSAMLKRAAIETEDLEIDSTSIDFYIAKHSNSFKIADRLDGISLGILKIYKEKGALEDALRYSNLSYEYLQLPKYLLTKAKILDKLNQKAKAIETLNEAVNHKFYESEKHSIDRLLKRIEGEK